MGPGGGVVSSKTFGWVLTAACFLMITGLGYLYLSDISGDAVTLRDRCHRLVQNYPRDVPFPRNGHVDFHAYWREVNSERAFGPRQAAVIKAFLASQNLNHTRFILWSTSNISSNPHFVPFLKVPWVQLRLYNVSQELQGTPLQHAKNLLAVAEDEKAYLDGDLFRLLILYKYGGLYLDMDTLLVNDLAPLLENEFMFEWDCDYRRTDLIMNGAVMRFYRGSNAITELLIELTRATPQPNSFYWGGYMYPEVYTRLQKANLGRPPWTVWPWCFFDQMQCFEDRSFELFEDVPYKKSVLRSVFAIHWHNRWDNPIDPNSKFMYIMGLHDQKLMTRFGTTFDYNTTQPLPLPTSPTITTTTSTYHHD